MMRKLPLLAVMCNKPNLHRVLSRPPPPLIITCGRRQAEVSCVVWSAACIVQTTCRFTRYVLGRTTNRQQHCRQHTRDEYNNNHFRCSKHVLPVCKSPLPCPNSCHTRVHSLGKLIAHPPLSLPPSPPLPLYNRPTTTTTKGHRAVFKSSENGTGENTPTHGWRGPAGLRVVQQQQWAHRAWQHAQRILARFLGLTHLSAPMHV